MYFFITCLMLSSLDRLDTDVLSSNVQESILKSWLSFYNLTCLELISIALDLS